MVSDERFRQLRLLLGGTEKDVRAAELLRVLKGLVERRVSKAETVRTARLPLKAVLPVALPCFDRHPSRHGVFPS